MSNKGDFAAIAAAIMMIFYVAGAAILSLGLTATIIWAIFKLVTQFTG